MTTTTTTNKTNDQSVTESVARVSIEPSTWVATEYSEGFGFEPDARLIAAVSAVLTVEASGFDRMLSACRELAAADEASSLSRPKRAELAAAVQADWPGRPGYCAQMSASTYSKRVRAGRATDDEVLAFLEVCDEPTVNRLYEWLPKLATGRPKGAKTARVATQPTATAVDEPVTSPEPVSAPETAPEPVQPQAGTVAAVPTRWDASHVATAAKAMVAALREQGADDVSARLVAAEAMRLLSPVRSVA